MTDRDHSTRRRAKRYDDAEALTQAVKDWATARRRERLHQSLIATFKPHAESESEAEQRATEALAEVIAGHDRWLAELAQGRNLQREAIAQAETCEAAAKALGLVRGSPPGGIRRHVKWSAARTREELEAEAVRLRALAMTLPARRDERAMLALALGNVALNAEGELDFSNVAAAKVDKDNLVEGAILLGLVTAEDYASLMAQAARGERDWPTLAEALDVERKRFSRHFR